MRERCTHGVGNGGSRFYRKKNHNWEQYTSMLGMPVAEAPFFTLYNCISGSICGSRHHPHVKISTPRFFPDKSSFHLSKPKFYNAFVSTLQ